MPSILITRTRNQRPHSTPGHLTCLHVAPACGNGGSATPTETNTPENAGHLQGAGLPDLTTSQEGGWRLQARHLTVSAKRKH